MADQFYVTTADPLINSDIPAVTLAATNKALVPVSNTPLLGAHFFGHIGKKVRIRVFGRMTTAATPGNLTIAVLYGTGADANGTSICASAATALQANQTSLSWEAVFEIHCRATGSTGSLFGTGRFHCNPALIASTAQPLMIPASLPAVTTSLDLTSTTNVLSVQALRSGNTAETMQVHDFSVHVLA